MEELPSSLYDEATDVHEEGSLVEAAPASEPMSLLQAAPDEAASGPDPPPAPDEATDVPAAEAAPVPASRAGLAEFFNRLYEEATDVPREELPFCLHDDATDVFAAKAAQVPASRAVAWTSSSTASLERQQMFQQPRLPLLLPHGRSFLPASMMRQQMSMRREA